MHDSSLLSKTAPNDMLFVADGPLRLEDCGWVGAALHRPECVLATASGDLYASDWRGGVTQIRPNGEQRAFLAEPVDGIALRPNGIALLRDGAFLIAHLGAATGGIFRLERNGQARPVLCSIDGIDLPPTNYAVEDASGRLWITVSTRQQPRDLGYRRTCDDGFIVMMDADGARIVADGLGYTNECAIDAEGRWLYVNETFSRKLSRFAIRSNGSLGPKQVVTEFGSGMFPDGVSIDEEGGLWVTSIVSNRVVHVDAEGRQTLWLEDADTSHLGWVEQAYASSTMGRPHLDGVKSAQLRNISSLAFGGLDRRTGYLGCLLGDRVAAFRMPVAGLAPVHWTYPSV